MNTALVLEIPQAEHVVSRWRKLHDPSAADGMPAHVTLVHPFRAHEEIDAEAEASLAHLFGQAAPFDLHFHETRRFPATSVLWLAPQNPAPVVALVRALGIAFPEHLPYAGAHPDTVPHLTVAHLKTPGANLDLIERDFMKEARPHLPLHARVEAASLFHNGGTGWRVAKQFKLGAG
ncbi:MAG: 2'-5' RNA ligase family protein [Parvibaculum sp.]|uniref:2'-5' RNA ligase family protein n=1 Tax=Parvibaculum sp. TaxID=2024848 RepID=UPI0025EBB9D4|nr:2'-5' RNA ligase family protein [Parvibaculum sp.]MCE9649746.1 2'-5' RNA ligase family protein [Parvibaculum sp.]